MLEAGRIEGETAVYGRLRGFAEQTGRSLFAEILITGRNLAVSLARSQQPYGFGRDAEQLGRAAVARDIGRVFFTPSTFYEELRRTDEAMAASFWRAWTKRDMSKLEQVVHATRIGGGLEVLSAPDERIHGRRRGSRGRVQGKRRSALVTDSQAMRAYVRKVQARVGMTKDGWADAAEECGGMRGIPAWAGSRHAGTHGGASIAPDAAAPGVTLRNTVPWAREGLPERVEQAAVAIAEERLVMRMERILKVTGDLPF